MLIFIITLFTVCRLKTDKPHLKMLIAVLSGGETMNAF